MLLGFYYIFVLRGCVSSVLCALLSLEHDKVRILFLIRETKVVAAIYHIINGVFVHTANCFLFISQTIASPTTQLPHQYKNEKKHAKK